MYCVCVKAIGRWAALLLVGAVLGFPLYWTVTMAFKPPAEWQPPGRVVWVPDHPTFANFETVLGLRGPEPSTFLQQPTRSALRPIANSLITAGGGTVIALVAGSLAAYGIARFRAGGRLFPFVLLQSRVFPILALVIPLFFVASEIEIWGTLWGLALVYGAVTLPIAVWLMRGYFLSVPHELAEAAIVDGCTHWGAFLKVMLPQVKGALAVTALFVFVLNWSDFAIASVVTDTDSQTATVYLGRLQSDEFERQYGPQAALSLLLMLPPIAFGLLARRGLVSGLTFGVLGR